MITLNRLKTMSDTDIQIWLRKVEPLGVGELVKGLLGADTAVRQCVLRNMSEKGGGLLNLTLERVKRAKLKSSEIESGTTALANFF